VQRGEIRDANPANIGCFALLSEPRLFRESAMKCNRSRKSCAELCGKLALPKNKAGRFFGCEAPGLPERPDTLDVGTNSDNQMQQWRFAQSTNLQIVRGLTDAVCRHLARVIPLLPCAGWSLFHHFKQRIIPGRPNTNFARAEIAAAAIRMNLEIRGIRLCPAPESWSRGGNPGEWKCPGDDRGRPGLAPS
jgi:hypothetical protein